MVPGKVACGLHKVCQSDTPDDTSEQEKRLTSHTHDTTCHTLGKFWSWQKEKYLKRYAVGVPAELKFQKEIPDIPLSCSQIHFFLACDVGKSKFLWQYASGLCMEHPMRLCQGCTLPGSPIAGNLFSELCSDYRGTK